MAGDCSTVSPLAPWEIAVGEQRHLEQAVVHRLADVDQQRQAPAIVDRRQQDAADLEGLAVPPERQRVVLFGHLSRLFRERYGVSFSKYLRELRMRKAAKLLSDTMLPIRRVAAIVGYQDPSRFAQHFRRRFQALPNLTAISTARAVDVMVEAEYVGSRSARLAV